MENKGEADRKEAMKQEAGRRAFEYESTYHGCCQCTLLALQEVLGLENELVFKAASCLMGMFPVESRTCGALTAGAMILGMKYGRGDVKEGIPSLTKGMLQTEKLVRRFKHEFGTTLCAELTGGMTDGVMDEKAIRYMAEHPEVMEKVSIPVIKKCAPVVRRVAELVIEIVNEEE